tara:strand:+ start:1535 stop:3415 length:1881 start_codon:yes stop_codon:yes gene_type:complete
MDWKSIKCLDPQPPWIHGYSFDHYYSKQFENYKNLYSQNLMTTLEYFKNYPLNSLTFNSFEDFKANPTPFSTVKLIQSDFDNGTVRLKWPAYYILDTDITFNPNPSDDWMPTPAQMSGGASAEYPGMPFGPYDLGFFAAITTEADNIILNLNGKLLKQSREHNLQQRFYANIELASTPFIPTQGPANFGDSIITPTNCYVTNGCLGLSSHHGIHGNGMKNVIIENINMYDYEVAGIALNGGEHVIVRNIHLTNLSRNIPVISTYSQARFIRPFLKALPDDFTFNLSSGDITAAQALIDIENDLNNAFTTIITNNDDLPVDSIFHNPTKLSDCDCYGLLFNPLGVAVNGFRKNRDNAKGNIDIVIHDCTIKKLNTTPDEIIGISKDKGSFGGGAYGGGEQVGPVGDVFLVQKVINDNGFYSKPNSLSNAQLLIGKYKLSGGKIKTGTSNIAKEIVDWAESQNTDIKTLVTDAEDTYYFVNGRDSMGHVMKGNIGLFISAAKDLSVYNVKIDIIKNEGPQGSVKFGNVIEIYDGASNRGVAITGSENIFMNYIDINNIYSTGGNSYGIDILGSSNEIQINNFNINGIESMCSTDALISRVKNANPIPKPTIINAAGTVTNLRLNKNLN